MIRNILIRPFRAVFFQLQRGASLSRQAAKAAPKLAKSITKVKLKPETRADYIETKGAFIAKPLFLMIIVVILLIGSAGYFIVWPWLESKFFVAHIPTLAPKAAEHSGRVVLYYDTDKTEMEYEGRLEEGVRQGQGKEYYQNGALKYEGGFQDGLYNGDGRLYDESGNPIYEGGFSQGLYAGAGTLYENGVRIYAGNFQEGLYEGQGTLYENGETPVYEGGFSQGEKSGTARVYENGALVYEGAYSQDAYNGNGKLFYPSGALKAEGAFSAGRMSGRGIEYHENGKVLYQGMFDLGVYEGEGVLYSENGEILYKGGFSLGEYEGEGTLYRQDGSKYIAGTFEGGQPTGQVQIYDEQSALLYAGGYENGAYQGEGKLIYSPGRWLEGTFNQGQPEGAVRLYVDGVLHYEGGYQNGAFNGAGKLYNTLGEVIFEGTFRSGLPDGMSLLGQNAEAVYALFGEGNYNEIQYVDGTLVVAPKANMAAFLCLPTVDAESVVHRFYCYDEGLLKGYTLENMPLPEAEQRLNITTGSMPAYDGVTALAGGRATQGRLHTETYYFTVWADSENGSVILAEYKSADPLPQPGAEGVLPQSTDAGTAATPSPTPGLY